MFTNATLGNGQMRSPAAKQLKKADRIATRLFEKMLKALQRVLVPKYPTSCASEFLIVQPSLSAEPRPHIALRSMGSAY
jgi:hypothetical protein